LSRRVLDALLSMPERHRFTRGLVSWVGYRQEAIGYNREPRLAGETKYPLRKMWRLAVDAITSFSTKPLQFAGIAGAVTVLLGLGLLAAGAWPLFAGEAVDGMLLLTGWMTLIGGTQLLGQGIMGEYIGRISEQSKGRPLFLIESVLQFDAAGNRIGGAQEDEEEAIQPFRWSVAARERA
jgi:dolichol-phosphate mannosyltransferase